MAASNAIASTGVTLKLGSTATTEVQDIRITGLKKATPEVTHHASPSRWREFISGLREGGEVTFDINYIPTDTTHTALIAQFNADTAGSWTLVWPDTSATKYSFSGILNGFEPTGVVDGKLTASITIKITGAINFNA